MSSRRKILIVYKCLGFPLRTTINEHLYSFRRYAKKADCFYLKIDPRDAEGCKQISIPDHLLKMEFDFIFFHYGLVSSRTAGKEYYDITYKQVLPLKKSKAIKAIFPQDEFLDSESIVHFINNMDINLVFSVSPESEWPQLYKGVDFQKTKFHKVLTGYLDEKGIRKINRFKIFIPKRIDIGYRARNLPQWLGRHGYLKTQIAEIFNTEIKRYDLKTDISVRPQDTFFGYGWYKFMLRCKYMIGVEGGSTVHDRDGEIGKKGRSYLEKHPNCTFEEIEKECFPDLDGKLQLIAISPRHLEACATETCQLLVESTFNGILKPGIHYIEIKKDFSNLSEVLELVKKDEVRKQVTQNAYRDIVQSGAYSYRSFVNYVLKHCGDIATDPYFSRKKHSSLRALAFNRFHDWYIWKHDYFYYKIYDKLPERPNRWFYIDKVIGIIKFFRLNKLAKISYFFLTGKKKFP